MRNLCSSWRRNALRWRPTPAVARYSSGDGSSSGSGSGSGNSTDRRSSDGGGPDRDCSAPPPPLAFLDVPYFEGEGACPEKHLLDVYIPSAPFPRPRARTCLFVHGGSWQRGDRRHPAVPDQFYGNVGRAFAARGLVGLVMSYRLAPGVQHPEQVRDVARAMKWARDNVSRYGGDGCDLVVVGHSAGAHLAALCLADGRWLEEAGVIGFDPAASSRRRSAVGGSASGGAGGAAGRGVDEGVPERKSAATLSSSSSSLPTPVPVVSGFVGISGVYDIPRMAGNVVGSILARTAFGNDRRAWRRVSPVHCVRAAAAAAAGAARGGTVDGGDSRFSKTHPVTTGLRKGWETDDRTAGNGVVDPDGTVARTTRWTVEGEIPAAAEEAVVAVAPGSRIGGHFHCPLLHTQVLLLTAASDFHLQDDAVALAEALDDARLRVHRASGKTADNGGSGSGEAQGTASAGRQQRGRQGEERENENPVSAEGSGGDERRRPKAGGGPSAAGEPSREDDRGGGGSVRHVRLDGEDHLSVMVSFAEPDAEISRAVLDFVIGLPAPRPKN